MACRHISHEWKRLTGAVTLRSSSLGTPSARNDFADSCNLPARRDVYIEIDQTVAMMASALRIGQTEESPKSGTRIPESQKRLSTLICLP